MPGKVAEEVRQGILQVLDPHLFLEIQECHRDDGDQDAKHEEVIDRCCREDDFHAIVLNHEDEPANKNEKTQRKTDDKDVLGLFRQDLEGVFEELPQPFPALPLVIELRGDLIELFHFHGIQVGIGEFPGPGLPGSTGTFSRYFFENIVQGHDQDSGVIELIMITNATLPSGIIQ